MKDVEDIRLSGAELAAARQTLGLTLVELAERLDVHKDTIHKWEAGVKTVAPHITALIAGLLAEHDNLVAEILATDAVVHVPRDGWWLSAAASARRRNPALRLEWAPRQRQPENANDG